tara:strand:- start:204 stop:839 length:636 start_codon:yes stop_codon:yes gene_type:complete
MDPAELDRYTVFDLEPTPEDWLTWAKEKVNQVIWDFINQNRNHLEHNDDVEPNKVYPSRRSWDRLNSTLEKANVLENGASPVLYQLTNAFVGMEAAVAFNDFVQNYERQVTVEDVLGGKALKTTKDFGVNEHNALVEKLENSDVLKEKRSDEEMQNVADYFVTLPSEVAMKFWQVMGRQNQDNAISLHKATSKDGIKVSSFMVEMLTGNKQ